MKNACKKTEAGRQYAAAHDAHYMTKDLSEALGLYRAVMEAHPQAQEAADSRSQIRNIVSAVVPKQALFDAHVKLALVHVAHGSCPSIAPNPVAPTVADSPGGTTWMAPLKITAMVPVGLELEVATHLGLDPLTCWRTSRLRFPQSSSSRAVEGAAGESS